MSPPGVGAPQQAQNYLVPSSGGTHFVPVTGVFGGTPYVVDFRQFTIDQFPFAPQGVFIDNSAGVGDLQVLISPGGWIVDCPAGARVSTSYPAPSGQQASITGNGQATVIFVDFPVLPNAGVVSVQGTVNVDVVSPNPLPVQVPASAAGTPYEVDLQPRTLTAFSGNISGAATTLVFAPVANSFLRKLYLAVSSDAAYAATGLHDVTVSVNGVVIFDVALYLVNPAVAVNGVGYSVQLNFDEAAPNVGAGNITISSNAFATGALRAQALVSN